MERRRDEGVGDRRRCLACGHDGSELQGETGQLVFGCPACGADLYARPPRTYAEMEGLSSRASRGVVGVCGLVLAAARRVLGRGGGRGRPLPKHPVKPGARSSDVPG